MIDVPPPDAEIGPGIITIQGWAMYGDGTPTAVRIRAGDLVDEFSPVGVTRPDVALALGRDERECGLGWRVDLDLRNAEVGPLAIEVEAFAGGIVGSARRVVQVVQHGLSAYESPVGAFGDIDHPKDGEELLGTVLHVGGWCLFPGSRVARVDVQLDGVPAGRARLHFPRGDVADQFQHVDAPVAGFEMHLVPFADQRPAEGVITAVAESLDGRTWHSKPVRFVLTAPTADSFEPRGDLLAQRTAQLLGSNRSPDRHGVLVFTHELSLGGGQLWLWDLVRQLHTEQDVPCRVVAPLDGPLRQRLEGIGIEVQLTEPFRVYSPDVYEGRVRELALLAESSGCHAVLLNTLGMFAAADAAQRAGLPTIWAIHESFNIPTFLYMSHGAIGVDPHVQRRFEAALSNATALVFEAQQTSEIFAEFNPERRFVIDYGIDLGAIDEFRATFDRARTRRNAGFDEDDTVVLVMGLFEPRKSQASVVAAFDELAGVHPDLRLALVGAHPSLYAMAVEDQIGRTGLADRIHVVDVTPDIYTWYGLSDLFLCASDVESLPRSILEAMAFELPIVATGVWGITDLIRDNQTGWLTQARDLESMMGVLHLVLGQDRNRWAIVAAAGRQYVEARRGAEHYARLLGAAFHRLAEDRDADLHDALSGRSTPAPLLEQHS